MKKLLKVLSAVKVLGFLTLFLSLHSFAFTKTFHKVKMGLWSEEFQEVKSTKLGEKPEVNFEVAKLVLPEELTEVLEN